VLFCDGNPLVKPSSSTIFSLSAKRDGFAETRQHIDALAAKFPGKVLIVHGGEDNQTAGSNAINWRANLGELDVVSGWTKLTVDPASPMLFTVKNETVDTSGAPR
jgi:hypothetical protein